MKVINLLIASIIIIGSPAYASVDVSAKLAVQDAYGKLPLYFIQNDGQMDGKVKFYEKGNGHSTFFTNNAVYLSLLEGQEKLQNPVSDSRVNSKSQESQNLHAEVIKLLPLGANKNPEIIAEEVLEGKVNYFVGNESQKWKTDIPTYRTIVYKEFYKGIDMKFYGDNRQMEYDIIVKPGAEPSKVKLSYEGIKSLKVAENGDLVIGLGKGNIIQKKPVVYQVIDGKRIEVEGKFKTQNLKQFAYGFSIGSYNKNYPLTIDPVLDYSTYLGGSSDDRGQSIAVDTSGNAYITGYTLSIDLPTASPIQGANAGGTDVFVTKINAAGNSLVYSTYLGGSGGDWGNSIAVDASGSAHITGLTQSFNFPMVSAIQAANAGNTDAFVTKINASGNNLVYSTYLGGNFWDYGMGIALDGFGNAYVTGYTDSANFPTLSPIQPTKSGADDVFVTKINSTGTSLVYSTYIGGNLWDHGYGLAVDNNGSAYITGVTWSSDYPTASPIFGTLGGERDAFVTKIDAMGSSLVYSTYLGGSNPDVGNGIVVDSFENAYITGSTGSNNFPTASAIKSTLGADGGDAFVTKIDATGSYLVYSTYLGGNNGGDAGYGIKVDSSRNAYITGTTQSIDFPTLSPIQSSNSGNYDAFVTVINAQGNNFIYSTYLGGNADDWGLGIAVDSSGSAYVTGETQSSNFPKKFPLDNSLGGASDAFITKINPSRK